MTLITIPQRKEFEQKILEECAQGNLSNIAQLKISRQEDLIQALIAEFDEVKYPYVHKLHLKMDVAETTEEEERVEELYELLSVVCTPLLKEPALQDISLFTKELSNIIKTFPDEIPVNVNDVAFFLFAMLRRDENASADPQLKDKSTTQWKELLYPDLSPTWLWMELGGFIDPQTPLYENMRKLLAEKLHQSDENALIGFAKYITQFCIEGEKFLTAMKSYLSPEIATTLLKEIYKRALPKYKDFPLEGDKIKQYSAICVFLDKNIILSEQEKELLKTFFKDEKNLSEIRG